MEEKRTIEGRRPVKEALLAGTQITRLIVQKGLRTAPIEEIISLATNAGIPIDFLDKGRLEKYSDTRNHQGVIAQTPPFNYSSFEDLLLATKDEPPFLLILDHIQDPHNLGALIRSAYASGAHGIVIPERRAAQMTPAAIRTSAGAAAYLPIARVVNIARCVDECKEAGLWIYGADMSGETLYSEGDYKGATALVIGSEGDGISRLVKEKCDHLVKLPMKGKVASLNASVAGGLLMYEVYRQRGF